MIKWYGYEVNYILFSHNVKKIARFRIRIESFGWIRIQLNTDPIPWFSGSVWFSSFHFSVLYPCAICRWRECPHRAGQQADGEVPGGQGVADQQQQLGLASGQPAQGQQIFIITLLNMFVKYTGTV